MILEFYTTNFTDEVRKFRPLPFDFWRSGHISRVSPQADEQVSGNYYDF